MGDFGAAPAAAEQMGMPPVWRDDATDTLSRLFVVRAGFSEENMMTVFANFCSGERFETIKGWDTRTRTRKPLDGGTRAAQSGTTIMKCTRKAQGGCLGVWYTVSLAVEVTHDRAGDGVFKRNVVYVWADSRSVCPCTTRGCKQYFTKQFFPGLTAVLYDCGATRFETDAQTQAQDAARALQAESERPKALPGLAAITIPGMPPLKQFTAQP